MKIIRLYTGPDGQSHFGDVEVPLSEQALGRLSDLVDAKGVIFRETPAGFTLDWHKAPQRQFVVLLNGMVEIEVGDGAKRRISAGDILFAEDVIGQGHISRDLSGPRRSIFIPVPDSVSVEKWRP